MGAPRDGKVLSSIDEPLKVEGFLPKPNMEVVIVAETIKGGIQLATFTSRPADQAYTDKSGFKWYAYSGTVDLANKGYWPYRQNWQNGARISAKIWDPHAEKWGYLAVFHQGANDCILSNLEDGVVNVINNCDCRSDGNCTMSHPEAGVHVKVACGGINQPCCTPDIIQQKTFSLKDVVKPLCQSVYTCNDDATLARCVLPDNFVLDDACPYSLRRKDGPCHYVPCPAIGPQTIQCMSPYIVNPAPFP